MLAWLKFCQVILNDSLLEEFWSTHGLSTVIWPQIPLWDIKLPLQIATILMGNSISIPVKDGESPSSMLPCPVWTTSLLTAAFLPTASSFQQRTIKANCPCHLGKVLTGSRCSDTLHTYGTDSFPSASHMNKWLTAKCHSPEWRHLDSAGESSLDAQNNKTQGLISA